jgi:hypothetical protein
MIYVSLVCFVIGAIFMIRSMSGYEEINSESWLDRLVLSLLWLNLSLSFLEDVLKYVS